MKNTLYLVRPTSPNGAGKYDREFLNLNDARAYAATVSKRLSERGIYELQSDGLNYILIEKFKKGVQVY